MTVIALTRDTIPAGTERVDSLPPWVRPRIPGGYWHQPRSAYVDVDRGFISVSFWCGSNYRRVNLNEQDLYLVDDAPVDMRCGTCAGRLAGFEGRDGLVFRPRDAFKLPSVCPGMYWAPPEHKFCEACGEPVKAAAGPYRSGSANHRPGPGIERWDPCPWHGWRHMAMMGERGSDRQLVCSMWGCRSR